MKQKTYERQLCIGRAITNFMGSNTEKIIIQSNKPLKGAYWISLNSSFIQYCDSNIGLFSIAPPLVIALCDSKVVAHTRS